MIAKLLLEKKFLICRRMVALVGYLACIRILVLRAMGSKVPVSVVVSGAKAPLYLRPATADIWMLLQVFGDEEYFRQELHDPKSILDLGANSGYASVYFANRYPKAEILAVEPDDENFLMLKRNLAPYEKCSTLKAACWDAPIWLRILDSRAESSEFQFVPDPADTDQDAPDKIRGITISQLAQQAGVARFGFIKIDIEGAEEKLLAAGKDWIDLVDAIAVEIHPWCEQKSLKYLAEITQNWQFRCQEGETYWVLRIQ